MLVFGNIAYLGSDASRKRTTHQNDIRDRQHFHKKKTVLIWSLKICLHVQSYKTHYKMNISTDKLINETIQLTYKLHTISLKNKDTLKIIIISLQKQP